MTKTKTINATIKKDILLISFASFFSMLSI